MFKNHIEVYKKVITLAQAVRVEYESNHREAEVVKVSDNIEELFTVTDKEKALRDYLEEQDYEVIKNIMVIMYLGRDKVYDEAQCPEEIFKQQRECFENHWDEKDIIIGQITSKMQLDKYLRSGLRILEIA